MTATHALGAALCLLATAARSDPPPVFKDTDCSRPVYTVKDKGAFFSVNCDGGVMVLNAAEARLLFGEREKMAETITLLEKRKTLSDQALQIDSQIRAQYEEMRKIDDANFTELKQRAAKGVELGEAAARNTDEALKLARRARLASYLSAGLVGATAGGLGGYIDSRSAGWTALGTRRFPLQSPRPQRGVAMIRWILSAMAVFLGAVTTATLLTAKFIQAGVAGQPGPLRGVPGAVGIVAGWLVLVVFYYAWAVYRFNVNLGLADNEWKALQPQLYGDAADVRNYGAQGRAEAAPDETTEAAKPFEEPSSNPYEGESFGLPPGTVRGTLALTAMVLFVATEMVNLQNPGLETSIAELITAFQMVLAFYFGARAVEVLDKKKTAAAQPAAAESSAQPSAPEPEPKPAQQEQNVALGRPAPFKLPEAAPLELPAMPTSVSPIRLAHIAAPSGAILPPPGLRLASDTEGTPPPPLVRRVLALTSSFETGVGAPDAYGIATGNFDGQGLSFGVLQWNIGQGTLQPLWERMRREQRPVLERVLGRELAEFERMLDSDRLRQMEWALTIQRTATRNGKTVWMVSDEWKTQLLALGRTPEMIDIEVEGAQRRFDIALEWCREYKLNCERGVALMFDINVQNGKVDRGGAGELIRADIAGISSWLSDEEQQVERMRIIANRRAQVVTLPAWREDVRGRKLTIAEGTGRVHGHDYDLKKEFLITLGPVPELTGQAPQLA